MAHVEGFPDRDGIKKLVTLAKAMCATVAAFTPLLLKKYPNNATIAALLAAIQGVCALIPEVENEFLIDTGENDVPLEDPSLIPGINEGLPPAPDPTA